jgi:hypothetical protein
MKKHFVTFYSPGTLVAETSTKPIDSWDVERAIEMSKSIKERYGALPYGFQFSTKTRKNDELDSKVTERSNFYWLGGTVKTLADVKAENDSTNKILISNMEINGYNEIITNNNSWQWTQPFTENDILLDIKPIIKG